MLLQVRRPVYEVAIADKVATKPYDYDVNMIPFVLCIWYERSGDPLLLVNTYVRSAITTRIRA